MHQTVVPCGVVLAHQDYVFIAAGAMHSRRHPSAERTPTGHSRMSAIEVPLHPRLREVTRRIAERSGDARRSYLDRIEQWRTREPGRAKVSCTNLAHVAAAFAPPEKQALLRSRWQNIAIVSSYNDMLSAHQPYERYPALIKLGARE
ncbi:MAG: hypothetical protein ABW110_17560, partial [Steroidobacteraceae bacterium]